MAKNKGRAKARRRKVAGLPSRTSESSANPPVPLYKRVAIISKAAAGAVAVAIGYVAAVPQLTIQTDFAYDLQDPYSQSVSVENEGFLPATSLSIFCTSDVKTSHLIISGAKIGLPLSNTMLSYKERLSLPCDRALRMGTLGRDLQDGSTMGIEATYKILGFLKRKQRFQFHSARGVDGAFHWKYD